MSSPAPLSPTDAAWLAAARMNVARGLGDLPGVRKALRDLRTALDGCMPADLATPNNLAIMTAVLKNVFAPLARVHHTAECVAFALSGGRP